MNDTGKSPLHILWQKRRSIIVPLSIILIVTLLWGGYYEFRKLYYYRIGVAALARGDWAIARDAFRQIGDVTDSMVLLKESYYRPMLIEIQAKSWDAAAVEAIGLEGLDSNYRDTSTLLSSYPDFLATVNRHRIDAWHTGKVGLTRTIKAHDAVNSVAFAPDGQSFAIGVGHRVGAVEVWQTQNNERLNVLGIRTLNGAGAGVATVAFSRDGTFLGAGGNDALITIWRTHNDEFFRTLPGHNVYVNSIAFSPDNQYLASGGDDSLVKLWRTQDGSLAYTLKGHVPPRTQRDTLTVAFSPDGQILASGAQDGIIKLWRVHDGALVRTFLGDGSGIENVAFSPSGEFIAAGRVNGMISIWRVQDGTQMMSLAGHSAGVNSVVFSPDEYIVASASNDMTIKLWRVRDGMLLQTLSGHTGSVQGLSFSADGHILASASDDATAKLWQAQP